jgi:hypothetical protein
MNVGESLKQFLYFIAGSIIQGVSLLMHMIFSDLREIVFNRPVWSGSNGPCLDTVSPFD